MVVGVAGSPSAAYMFANTSYPEAGTMELSKKIGKAEVPIACYKTTGGIHVL